MSPQAIGSLDRRARPPQAAEPQRAAAPSEFASLLQQHLAEPARRVAGVRAAIDAIRDGVSIRGGADDLRGPSPAAFPSVRSARVAPARVTSDLLPYQFERSGTPDPFGWRSLSRQLGDELVAPGFGAIFERQIEQESGFAPEVAFGLRRSAAGAEGIAQLMPGYYPAVDRADPRASLVAGARTMSHNLAVFDGDVRKALASYNAGLGRVQSLIAAHGDGWERALPAETRRYLAAIVGNSRAEISPPSVAEAAVFGGRGLGGVLTLPLDPVLGERSVDGLLELLAAAGAEVRAPAGGLVLAVGGSDAATTVVLDHGNGWRTSIEGLAELLLAVGQDARRSQGLGVLAANSGAGQGRLRLGVSLDGRPVPPERYLLRA